MKPFLPKQHGAWAMLLIPFWLGVIGSKFVWQHIPFFIGWILLYLATYPLLLTFKKKKVSFYLKWTFIYLIPGLLLLFIPFFYRVSIFYFGLAMIPFFFVNAYFSKHNQDRALLNDFSAIIVFSIAGLASYYLPLGYIDEKAFFIFIVSTIFFIGSTYYVKSMIREKRNEKFKWTSWIYHISIILLGVILQEWFVVIALLPSLIRAILLYGKIMSPKKIGIYEIINAVYFFIIISFSI